jgi:hypothetical protein
MGFDQAEPTPMMRGRNETRAKSSSSSRDDLSSKRRQRLTGRPLSSQARFLVKRLTLVLLYLVVVVGALLVAFRLEQWLLKGVGWAVLAILAAVVAEIVGDGIFEIHKIFDYGEYREEWEQANRCGLDGPC